MRKLFILLTLIATGIYFYSLTDKYKASANILEEEQYILPEYTVQEELLNNYEQVSFTKQEECLAEAIYFEARGEPFLGQVAVGVVIMKKGEIKREESPRFPNNICDVVHDGVYWRGNPVRNKCAFSYYCDGKSETIYKTDDYIRVLDATQLVLNGIVVDKMEDVLFYHATYINPSWSKDMTLVFQIGKHKFYKE
jgi:spore germination cell wall hydrolase CwlJ-like protein